MPGRDGTGPSGRGPFTGKGRGVCVYPVDKLPQQIKQMIASRKKFFKGGEHNARW